MVVESEACDVIGCDNMHFVVSCAGDWSDSVYNFVRHRCQQVPSYSA